MWHKLIKSFRYVTWSGDVASIRLLARPPTRIKALLKVRSNWLLWKWIVCTGVNSFDICKAGFFLTPAPEKTKNQENNSSQKLKKKNSILGEQFLPLPKTHGKNSSLKLLVYKRIFSDGDRLFMPFLFTKIFKFGKFWVKNWKLAQNFLKL